MKRLCLSLYTLLFALNTALADQAPTSEHIKDLIWQKELQIYESWGKTGLEAYINFASEYYMGWPPGADVPSDFAGLKQYHSNLVVPNLERRSILFRDFTHQNGTAIVYFTSLRSRLPDGTFVSEYLDVAHIWTKTDKGDWKIIGAHGRPSKESSALSDNQDPNTQSN